MLTLGGVGGTSGVEEHRSRAPFTRTLRRCEFASHCVACLLLLPVCCMHRSVPRRCVSVYVSVSRVPGRTESVTRVPPQLFSAGGAVADFGSRPRPSKFSRPPAPFSTKSATGPCWFSRGRPTVGRPTVRLFGALLASRGYTRLSAALAWTAHAEGPLGSASGGAGVRDWLGGLHRATAPPLPFLPTC